MLQDEQGLAVFPDNSHNGLFCFIRASGDPPRPFMVTAEVEKCVPKLSATGWKARFRRFSQAQADRHGYNPQMTIPLESVPAYIAALSRLYEQAAHKDAPPEAQGYVKQTAQDDADRAAQAYVRGDSEF